MTTRTPLHRTASITQQSIDTYAEVSGDRNPIHVDPAWAAQSLFGTTIAHGQLVLGHVSALFEDEFGVFWTEGGVLDVKFVSPVHSGETISIDVTPRGPGFSIDISDSSHRTVVVGSAEIRMGA